MRPNSGTPALDYAERIVGFIERERRCCPFLVFEPEERRIWLYFGGDERVKAYLKRQFEAN